MSEPTSAQEEQAADAMLDSQIAEYLDTIQATVRGEQPPENYDYHESPESHWYDDRDEVAAFARWYFDTGNYIGFRKEILNFIEKPWHWDEEYAGYKAENP